jgi:hypothetical protein
MKPELITKHLSIVPDIADSGAYVWSFTLLGEVFGGYCRTIPECRAESQRHVEAACNGLTGPQLDEAYTGLVGYPPIAECGEAEDDVRQLLADCLHGWEEIERNDREDDARAML